MTAVRDRYRLGRTLGAGGMGRVWQARDEILDRDVALKEILLPDALVDADREALRRHTLREGRAAARLSHPGVAQVYDAFETEGRAWIVMEYVPSRSLQEALDADGPLPPHEAAEIGLAVLEALISAHAAGVRHRDVKPANVLLATDGRVVLTDFGVAAVDGESLVTSSGLVMGSPSFMAPERIRDGETSPAGDLWSLGATLYTAVEGHPPYARPSVMETITAVISEEPPPAQHAAELNPVLEGLLRKSPTDRIDAAEAKRLLQTAISSASAPAAPSAEAPAAPPVDSPDASTAVAPVAPPADSSGAPPAEAPGGAPDTPPPAMPARRRIPPALLAAAVAILLVVAAGIAWMTLRPDSHKSTTAVPTSPASAAAASSGPSASAAVAPTPAATATATPTAPGSGSGNSSQSPESAARPPLPAGWTLYRDSTGFSLYVPQGWKRTKEHGMVYFRAPGRVLGIDQTKTPQWNPVADWRGKADYRVARGDFPNYHEIHIREVKYFVKAADWEFTFGSGVRQHVNNRGVVTSAHQAYGIYWQTSDAGWAAAQKDLRLVFESFRPAK
jgi:hypothetical protein